MTNDVKLSALVLFTVIVLLLIKQPLAAVVVLIGCYPFIRASEPKP